MASKNKLYRSIPFLLALCCGAPQVHGDPATSQAQAEATAQRFLLRVAGPAMNAQAISGTNSTRLSTKVVYHAADKAPDDPSNQDFFSVVGNHPRGYWRVERLDSYHLEVDDVTGYVLSYGNYTALDVDGDPPAGESIPKAEVRQLAEAALRATGTPLGNFVFSSMGEYQNHMPPLASGHEWDVCWTRTFQGVPYPRKGAEVYLNAETGRIISVSFGVPYTDPTITSGAAITQEQARSVAEAQLNAVGLAVSDLPVVTVQKQIVPFNRYWETGDVQHHSLKTRVVWNFHYGVPLETIEVWVDAATGDVVGGSYEGTLGNGVKIPMPKFGRQLKPTELVVKVKQ